MKKSKIKSLTVITIVIIYALITLVSNLFNVFKSSIYQTTANAISTSVYVSSSNDISGSISSYKGSINAGSNQLILTSSHDFKIGQGIAIEKAGNYHDNWLRTTISSINGNTITLSSSATAGAYSVNVDHDDSVALQSLIRSLSANSTLIFDVPTMNIDDVELVGNINYSGNGCIIYTPRYDNQNNPNKIYNVFYIKNAQNIIFSNFIHNGGKQRGVNGNDQFGTSFIVSTNASGVQFLNNESYENWYVEYRNLDTQTNITYRGNKITNTDVAINFMAAWNSTSIINGLVIENNNINAVNCNSEAIAIIPATYNWRNNSTGAQLAQLNNLTIRNNYINKPGRIALVYGGSIGKNILIEGNTFGSSMIAVSSYDGVIELLQNGSSNPYLNSSDGTIMKNNNFGTATYEHVRLAGKNITLDKNIFGASTNGGSLIVNQDVTDINGIFEIKNHSFVADNRRFAVFNDINKMGSITAFNHNSIKTTSGPTCYYSDATLEKISNSFKFKCTAFNVTPDPEVIPEPEPQPDPVIIVNPPTTNQPGDNQNSPIIIIPSTPTQNTNTTTNINKDQSVIKYINFINIINSVSNNSPTSTDILIPESHMSIIEKTSNTNTVGVTYDIAKSSISLMSNIITDIPDLFIGNYKTARHEERLQEVSVKTNIVLTRALNSDNQLVKLFRNMFNYLINNNYNL